jgi:MATE family multidrug resistance protein
MARARLVPTGGELREMSRLAAPIVIVNLGLMFQGTIDTLMLGRVSAQALAAGAVGNLYFFNVMFFGMGLLMSLDPVVAQAIGARNDEGAARGVQRGLVLALLMSLVAGLAMVPADTVLRFARQPDAVVPAASAYVRWSIAGVLPFLVFNALRQTLQAMHRVLPMAMAVVLSNAVNALLNWIFIFGKFGVPAMGVVGAAHATWISRWFMAAMIVWLSWRDLRPVLVPWRRAAFAMAPLTRMIALGAPIGFQMFAEGFAFGFTGLLMGWLGTATLAAHQVTINLAALTFMVPMGVAGAGAVMVGRAIGAGDMDAARRDSVAALACGVGFMGVMGVLLLSFPVAIARLYTTDVATVVVAASILPIAGVFQIFDGTQVVASSILRGAGDTRVPMILHILSFWAVGIPLGVVLAFPLDYGARGLWWGLTAGLATAALLQLVRVRSRLSGNVVRVRLD